jgi:hypothetical protein
VKVSFGFPPAATLRCGETKKKNTLITISSAFALEWNLKCLMIF